MHNENEDVPEGQIAICLLATLTNVPVVAIVLRALPAVHLYICKPRCCLVCGNNNCRVIAAPLAAVALVIEIIVFVPFLSSLRAYIYIRIHAFATWKRSCKNKDLSCTYSYTFAMEHPHVGTTSGTASGAACRYKDYYDWQQIMSQKVIIPKDDENGTGHWKWVAGLDISTCKTDECRGVGALVVQELPSFRVVYEDYESVTFDSHNPDHTYVPGMLGRREVPVYLKLLSRLQERDCILLEQTVFLMDGGGRLHPRRFGSACQLAIEWSALSQRCIRTVGVAKNYLNVGDHTYICERVADDGMADIYTHTENPDEEEVLGRKVCFAANSKKPIYISVGNGISLNAACELVRRCCLYRVPEPIRQADLRSRVKVRENKQ